MNKYDAEYGLTWEEWCDMKYSMSEFYVGSDSYIYTSDNMYYVTNPNGETPALATDLLIPDASYGLLDAGIA